MIAFLNIRSERSKKGRQNYKYQCLSVDDSVVAICPVPINPLFFVKCPTGCCTRICTPQPWTLGSADWTKGRHLIHSRPQDLLQQTFQFGMYDLLTCGAVNPGAPASPFQPDTQRRKKHCLQQESNTGTVRQETIWIERIIKRVDAGSLAAFCSSFHFFPGHGPALGLHQTHRKHYNKLPFLWLNLDRLGSY